MIRDLAVAAMTLLQAAHAPVEPQGVWRLECGFGGAEPRVFRLGPGLLQERAPPSREFGPNLCQSLQCTSEAGRLKGSVSSASLIFNLEFDPQTRRASWRTVGASGAMPTSGSCTATPESASSR